MAQESPDNKPLLRNLQSSLRQWTRHIRVNFFIPHPSRALNRTTAWVLNRNLPQLLWLLWIWLDVCAYFSTTVMMWRLIVDYRGIGKQAGTKNPLCVVVNPDDQLLTWACLLWFHTESNASVSLRRGLHTWEVPCIMRSNRSRFILFSICRAESLGNQSWPGISCAITCMHCYSTWQCRPFHVEKNAAYGVWWMCTYIHQQE